MQTELIDLLRTVTAGFQACMQQRVAAEGAGLGTFQARLLNLIGRNEGISQLGLGSFTDRDKAQIARAVKELETRGLVSRTPHPSDWRTKCLALTAGGKQLHMQLHDVRQQLAIEMFASLSEDEKQALHSILGKMAATLED